MVRKIREVVCKSGSGNVHSRHDRGYDFVINTERDYSPVSAHQTPTQFNLVAPRCVKCEQFTRSYTIVTTGILLSISQSAEIGFA